MGRVEENEKGQEQIIDKVCTFLKLEKSFIDGFEIKEAIKRLCIIRLCKAIGMMGKSNSKSPFFEFFANIMGEAICEKLEIKQHIAPDELRLIKYNRINLIGEAKSYLDNETVEEAFLDTFFLVDKFKDIIPMLKKPSES